MISSYACEARLKVTPLTSFCFSRSAISSLTSSKGTDGRRKDLFQFDDMKTENRFHHAADIARLH
jgi:hypothetical protein